MKYIIYHRYPSYEADTGDVDKTLDILTNYLRVAHNNYNGPEVIVEEANNLLSQTKLRGLINRIKNDDNDSYKPNETTILCYDLCSLVNAPLKEALTQLDELLHLVRVEFLNVDMLTLAKLSIITKDYQEEIVREKSKLLAYRLAKNGLSYGRPTIDVDIEKATKLRSEGLSYKEISEKLNQSLSLIYSKLPKEVKRLYRNGKYPKVGRPRIKTEGKTEEKGGDTIV